MNSKRVKVEARDPIEENNAPHPDKAEDQGCLGSRCMCVHCTCTHASTHVGVHVQLHNNGRGAINLYARL